MQRGWISFVSALLAGLTMCILFVVLPGTVQGIKRRSSRRLRDEALRAGYQSCLIATDLPARLQGRTTSPPKFPAFGLPILPGDWKATLKMDKAVQKELRDLRRRLLDECNAVRLQMSLVGVPVQSVVERFEVDSQGGVRPLYVDAGLRELSGPEQGNVRIAGLFLPKYVDRLRHFPHVVGVEISENTTASS